MLQAQCNAITLQVFLDDYLHNCEQSLNLLICTSSMRTPIQSRIYRPSFWARGVHENASLVSRRRITEDLQGCKTNNCVILMQPQQWLGHRVRLHQLRFRPGSRPAVQQWGPAQWGRRQCCRRSLGGRPLVHCLVGLEPHQLC